MRRTFYWNRFLIVVAVAGAFVGGVFAVHHFQAKSQSSIVKDRAMVAAVAAEADPAQRAEAIELFAKYLKFKPKDEEAFKRYANLLLEDAKADPTGAARVADRTEAFLVAFPNHPPERRKLVELYLATGQLTKLPLAKQHIEMLFAAPGGDYRTNVELLEMAAECERGQGNLAAAIAHLEAAIKTDKAPVRVYVLALNLHSANKKEDQRNSTASIVLHLRELRSGRFEKNLEARVAAARFELTHGNLGPAREDLDIAFGRKAGFSDLGGNSSADALLAQAQLELAEIKGPEQLVEQRTKAETALRKAFGLDPKNVAVGMLLAEVLTTLGKLDEGVKVLERTATALGPIDDKTLQVIDRLIDLGEQEFSGSLVETKLVPNATMKPFVTYFRGRLAVLKADWATALPLLEKIAPVLVRAPDFHKKAMVGLATCYAGMQNPDKQLEFCRAALKDDKLYPPAIVGEAEALARMGKHAEARDRYWEIVNAYQLTAFRTELVRLELLLVLMKPGAPETRNWRPFNESLGVPETRTPDGFIYRTPEIQIFYAESLIARGQEAKATQALEGWLTAHPKDEKAPVVWVALSRAKDGGKVETAEAVLAEAQKALGRVTVEIQLARAALLVARAKLPTPDEFDKLQAGAETFSKPDQSRLLLGLGQMAGRVADRGPDGEPTRALRTAALRFLRAAADLSPKDLPCRAILLDQGLAAGRMDVVHSAIQEMASAEGENGPVALLGQIAVRLPDVRKIDDLAARTAGVKELRELARRVRELRPGWSRVYIAIAQLDEIEGLNDDALANYSEAIEKGDRHEYVIRRTVDLYRTKQQDDKAVGLLDRLSPEVRLPDDLERYRAIRALFLKAEPPKDARPTIDRNAPADSPDYRILLLRGALLGVIGDDADALAAFKRAVELADKVPDTWAALVAQFMRHDEVEEAKKAVAEAKKKLTAVPLEKAEARADLELALAGLYEIVGDLKTAFDHYSAALKIAPLELNPTRQLVLFFQRTGQMDKAAALLNAATGSTAQDIARWARRHLALTLVGRPDAYTFRAEALASIEQNLKTAPNDPEDLKARARIWTVDPVTREEGVRVLRQFGDRGDLTPDEYYLLGRMSFDQGGAEKYAESERYFRLAARLRPGVMPEHLAAVVRVYLALNLVDRAEGAVRVLKANNPKSWEAAREEARVLARRSKDKAAANDPEQEKKLLAQARAAVMAFPGWDAVPNLASKSGPLFEELGLFADAKAAYTKYLTESGTPGGHAPLAVLYIHQKQPDEAIALARKYEKNAPVLLTARLLTGAVRAKRPDPATEAEIATWLDGALRAAVGQPELEAGLIGARAELLDAQGKSAEAIAEYERAIAKGKSDLLVNNLCVLLALKSPERAEEAVKMMSEMIAIRGPFPPYLDTRALAYLVSGRPVEAEKDLRMALVQHERAAYLFHLAWALDLDTAEGKRISAVQKLERAKALGLTAADLHPLEFKRYIELFAKYKLAINDR